MALSEAAPAVNILLEDVALQSTFFSYTSSCHRIHTLTPSMKCRNFNIITVYTEADIICIGDTNSSRYSLYSLRAL